MGANHIPRKEDVERVQYSDVICEVQWEGHVFGAWHCDAEKNIEDISMCTFLG